VNIVTGSIAGILFFNSFYMGKGPTCFSVPLTSPGPSEIISLLPYVPRGDCPEKQTGIYLLMFFFRAYALVFHTRNKNQ
jgi:hypothetical protein